MAIQSDKIDAVDTTIYTSVDETAITFISFCNYSAADATVTIHVVKNGVSPSDFNIFIKDITITAGDTFIAYSGGEKIILDDGDYINAIASTANALTAITSYVKV